MAFIGFFCSLVNSGKLQDDSLYGKPINNVTNPIYQLLVKGQFNFSLIMQWKIFPKIFLLHCRWYFVRKLFWPAVRKSWSSMEKGQKWIVHFFFLACYWRLLRNNRYIWTTKIEIEINNLDVRKMNLWVRSKRFFGELLFFYYSWNKKTTTWI